MKPPLTLAAGAAAINWIAHNDEPGESDPEVVATQLTVVLIADLWGKTPEEVAQLVLKRRQKEDIKPVFMLRKR